MMDRLPGCGDSLHEDALMKSRSGFTLTEFLLSTVILFIAAAALFSVAADIQRTAGYHAEVQSVLNNARIAMQTIQRYIRQAGNDPQELGVAAVTIIGPEELRIQSDLTGSAGLGNPDKGDPDGDIEDSAEDVTIRYNDRTRSLEVVSAGGAVQIVAGSISGLTFAYYDAGGNPAASGTDVRSIRVLISGSSRLRDPQTHQSFGVQLCSEIRVSS